MTLAMTTTKLGVWLNLVDVDGHFVRMSWEKWFLFFFTPVGVFIMALILLPLVYRKGVRDGYTQPFRRRIWNMIADEELAPQTEMHEANHKLATKIDAMRFTIEHASQMSGDREQIQMYLKAVLRTSLNL